MRLGYITLYSVSQGFYLQLVDKLHSPKFEIDCPTLKRYLLSSLIEIHSDALIYKLCSTRVTAEIITLVLCVCFRLSFSWLPRKGSMRRYL